MSSYVIGKINYIRCAGAIVGMSEGFYRDPLWVYNHRDNRNFNEDDYKTIFTWLYEANAKSVQLQYDDDTCESDTNDYSTDFEEYKKIGKQAVYHGTENHLVKEIAKFFSSIKYQIEDDDLSRKVSCYLNIILVALAEKTVLENSDVTCWGEFKLEKPDTEIIDIMDMI